MASGRPRRPTWAGIGWALRMLDGFFFVFAGAATLWLAVVVLEDSFRLGWWGIPVLVLFWILLAYLALPRLHRVLSAVYVPDYFIGRTRTSDGLLGDPVNLAFIGDETRLHRAMTAAGWTRADEVTLRSSARIVAATLRRRSYPQAPVSPLMLFGRQQDFAYQQEIAGNPAKRHHVRFWKCPDGWLLPGGHRADWLAAATFDRAVGLSLFTLQITHKIDEDIDVERDHVVATLTGDAIGVDLRVIEDFSTGYHSRNGGGDSIHTDGDLPILDVGGVHHPAALHTPDPNETGVLEGPPVQTIDTVHGPSRKRTAYEPFIADDPVEESAAEEVRRHGRPATVTFGAMMTIAAALVGGGSLAAGLFLDETPSGVAGQIGGWASVAFGITLGVLVLRGSGAARVATLAMATLSSAGALTAWPTEGSAELGFVGVTAIALDILVLLALSGAQARQYTRSFETSPRAR